MNVQAIGCEVLDKCKLYSAQCIGGSLKIRTIFFPLLGFPRDFLQSTSHKIGFLSIVMC